MRNYVCVAFPTGQVLTVALAEGSLVRDCKMAIATKLSSFIPYFEGEFDLIVAKSNGSWLLLSASAIKEMQYHDVKFHIKRVPMSTMDPNARLDDLLEDMDSTYSNRVYHIIVYLPNTPQRLVHLWKWLMPRYFHPLSLMATASTIIQSCIPNISIDIDQYLGRGHLWSRLVVNEDEPIIRLQSCHIQGSGVRVLDETYFTLVFYRRPSFDSQWQKLTLYLQSDIHNFLILGPTGSGKSCAALVYAHLLAQSGWFVVWMHFEDADSGWYVHFNLIFGELKWIFIASEGNLMKWLYFILYLLSPTRRTIVFLDGYVKHVKCMEAVLFTCQNWWKENRYNHRFVHVSTVVAPGAFFCHGKCTENTYEKFGFGGYDYSTTGQRSMEQYCEAKILDITPWRWDDYKKAILNYTFFQSVAKLFPSYKRSNVREEEVKQRLELMDLKYAIAGGNVEQMFGRTTMQAIKYVRVALEELSKSRCLSHSEERLYYCRLFVPCLNVHMGYDIGFVSSFVARTAARMLGPRLIQMFTATCNVNYSNDSYAFEAWFIAELHFNGVKWHINVGSGLHTYCWKQECISLADPGCSPNDYPESDGGIWIAPSVWTHGSFDVVYLDRWSNLVRFVLLGRQYVDYNIFTNFVSCLLDKRFERIDKMELYFAVPYDKRKTFQQPTSQSDFYDNVIKCLWDKYEGGLQHCQMKVEVIGVVTDFECILNVEL